MGAQVLEETVTDNETKVAAKASTVLVEKRDGRVVDFDPINIISAVKSAFGDLNKEVGPEEDAMIRGFANQVEGEIKGRYTGPAKIEDIQNLVEHALIDAHLYDVLAPTPITVSTKTFSVPRPLMSTRPLLASLIMTRP